MTTAELITHLRSLDPHGTMQIVVSTYGSGLTNLIEVEAAVVGDLRAIFDSVDHVGLDDSHHVVTVVGAAPHDEA